MTCAFGSVINSFDVDYDASSGHPRIKLMAKATTIHSRSTSGIRTCWVSRATVSGWPGRAESLTVTVIVRGAERSAAPSGVVSRVLLTRVVVRSLPSRRIRLLALKLAPSTVSVIPSLPANTRFGVNVSRWSNSNAPTSGLASRATPRWSVGSAPATTPVSIAGLSERNGWSRTLSSVWSGSTRGSVTRLPAATRGPLLVGAGHSMLPPPSPSAPTVCRPGKVAPTLLATSEFLSVIAGVRFQKTRRSKNRRCC